MIGSHIGPGQRAQQAVWECSLNEEERWVTSARTPDAAASVDFEEVQATEQFQELRKRHRSFVFPMAVAFLLWYFAYVLLADYAVGFMSTKVWGNINVGLILGLLQFVTTFAITGWYVSYSQQEAGPHRGGDPPRDRRPRIRQRRQPRWAEEHK